MRAADLDLLSLLDCSSEGGVVRFAGQRVVIMDAVALGLWRKELIETVGVTVARGVLTRFGFAHGWRTAQSLKDAFPWDNEREWRIAGGRVHMLQGVAHVDPGPPGGPAPRRDQGQGGEEAAPFAEATWRRSYEAEQHLLHHGRADEPVCWTMTGFASGYMSHVNGAEIYCLEDRCVAAGDPECHILGRTREAWGKTIEPTLQHYQRECLDAALAEVTRSLKQAERRLREHTRRLREAAGALDEVGGICARSAAMRRVLDLARRVAKVDATALITGESGAGKERVARLIHEESPRAKGLFLAVNCGAVTETLLESELFGHARGAFTGATTDRAGLFEAASGGTLLLDEIGEIPPAMQVKLLRVLQEREVRRVGESKPRPVDARIVAATNRDLSADVQAGRFRRDLYYRLRVVEIVVPPLRDRRDDILPLARAFLTRHAARLARATPALTPAAAEHLLRHAWPGNVRELENALERAVILTDGSIDLTDLPDDVLSPPGAPAAPAVAALRPLADVERDHILSVLGAVGGNRANAAAALQIGTATLYRKLKTFDEGR